MLDASISSFAMSVGGWGPAFDEKRDVGNKHFNYPALITSYGIIEMVMGNTRALQVLLFKSAPEYGDIHGDTVYLIDLNKNI